MLRYANGGLQGELSSPPDRIIRFLSDVDGVSLVDYAYDASGAATRTVFGLHVGVFEPGPGASLTFAGDGGPAIHTRATASFFTGPAR